LSLAAARRAPVRPASRHGRTPVGATVRQAARLGTAMLEATNKEIIMVPIIAWLLGVPLVVILLFMLLF
jgi:hypothetical protein